MGDMIERVARAMAQLITETGQHPDAHMGHCMVLAHAALNAMRRPTDAMVEAGDIWADGPGYSIKVLDAMIDAALGKVSGPDLTILA